MTTLVNIAPALSSWSGAVSDGIITFDSTSKQYASASTDTLALNGHVYYERIELKTDGSVTVGTNDCAVSWQTTDGKYYEVAYIGLGGSTLDLSEWTIYSGVRTRSDMDDAGVSAYMIARAYLSSGTALYIRNVMVVDLTAAYGAGNEPTAAWMESHIPYFTGTYEILELHPGDTFSPSEDMTLYAAWGRVKPSLSPNPVGTGESVLVSVEVEEP